MCGVHMTVDKMKPGLNTRIELAVHMMSGSADGMIDADHADLGVMTGQVAMMILVGVVKEVQDVHPLGQHIVREVQALVVLVMIDMKSVVLRIDMFETLSPARL